MKEKLIPLFSIVIGFIAFVLTLQYWRTKREEIEKAREAFRKETLEVSAVVAGRDIPQGAKISPNDLGKSSIARTRLPRDFVEIHDAAKILGKKTLFQISNGEPIAWSRIEGGGPDVQALANMITMRMRAISIPVSGPAAVSGMIRPGDRVDVLGTFNFSSKKTPGEMETATLTVLQDITVMATGRQTANQLAGRSPQARSGDASYSAVTLEVTPKEAELLVFAQQARGQLFLALRNPSDASFEADLPTVNFDHLQHKLQEYNAFRQNEVRRKANWK
ncbi:MAG: Flp pilus assembly protein CpaB [Verrucomicrobiota bacterium]|nr:Flp pilus assembly protein CpaB [Verrucomicrobiota bacterium]